MPLKLRRHRHCARAPCCRGSSIPGRQAMAKSSRWRRKLLWEGRLWLIPMSISMGSGVVLGSCSISSDLGLIRLQGEEGHRLLARPEVKLPPALSPPHAAGGRTPSEPSPPRVVGGGAPSKSPPPRAPPAPLPWPARF
jgi:hypothetical protein